MKTTVDILCFIRNCIIPDNQLLKSKYAFNLKMFTDIHDICQDLNFTNNTNFQSHEVVDRGSETQLKVAENLNFLAQCSKG